MSADITRLIVPKTFPVIETTVEEFPTFEVQPIAFFPAVLPIHEPLNCGVSEVLDVE